MSSQDLDEDALAAYLHLTPSQVRRLADRDQLPGRKIGGAWRFAEAEIHTWLEEKIGASDADELTKFQPVVDRWSKSTEAALRLSDLTQPEAIEVPFSARTRSSVVRRICALAEKTGLLWDAPRMVEVVLAREQMHSTALDDGVALLHPRRPQSTILGGPILALGVSTQPIAFGNRSGHLTDIFFLLCSTDDKVHLQLLSKLSHLIAKPDFLEGLRSSESPTSAYETITQFEDEFDEEQSD
ncbi:MAG: PTS sugar transporter subunit IIA [Pirellulaceae bacterium]